MADNKIWRGAPGSRRERLRQGLGTMPPPSPKELNQRPISKVSDDFMVTPQKQSSAEDIADAVAEFEDFKETILPSLQQDLKDGHTEQQLREKYLALATARIISLLSSHKPEVALSAAKDIIDRTIGKAVERKAHIHKMDGLSEQEIDALILSKLTSGE